jgi:hypothetical protein
MPVIKVYHNSNFLDYRGNHADIAPPIQPIATVQVPDGMPVEQALEIAYRQTQHLDDVNGGWWNREGVILHVRSTSVGDVLADAQGNLFVVESVGFRPYQSKAIRSYHRLAEAYRLLDEALACASADKIMVVASQTRSTMRHVLESEGYTNGEIPIFSWDKAQPGDLVGSPDTGLFRVIARKLRPKWRAKRFLAHVPGAQVWMDSPPTWAVLVPVVKEGETP